MPARSSGGLNASVTSSSASASSSSHHPSLNSNFSTHRRQSSPLVSPLPSSGPSSSSRGGNQLHVNRDRNAAAAAASRHSHSRTTSWSTGRDLLSGVGDSGDFILNNNNNSYTAATGTNQFSGVNTPLPRRRRESSLSHASVSEREQQLQQQRGLNESQDDYDSHDYSGFDDYYDGDSSHLKDKEEDMALRNTSMDWKGYHARSRSQTTTALQDQELPILAPNPSASASSSPMNTTAPSFLPSASRGPPSGSGPGPAPVSASSRPGPVTWMSLPRKKQLGILGLCRVFDFLQIASLQAYMFYQLKSFDQNLSDSDVSTQAGILQGAFTAAQFATAIPWGRVADAEWGGRKFVLLVGLLGTSVSCLGVAFAKSFAQAVFWRSFGGAINGTVGIIRTAIAENVKEKKYHSRAFLILPIGFNIASLFGPGESVHSGLDRKNKRMMLTFASHGWYASRSGSDLSHAVWSKFVVWWPGWCPMAYDLSLCLAHVGQRCLSSLVRWLCRHVIRGGKNSGPRILLELVVDLANDIDTGCV